MVYEKHPSAVVFVLGAFCGWCYEELGSFVDNYNAEKGKTAVYINTHGWIPPEPLHPGREGHKIVAERLINFLKQGYIAAAD